MNTKKKEVTANSLPFHRKVTYGFTDMAGNILFSIIGSYMLYFFTNVYGLSITVAGMILLLGRFVDAFGAPFIGILVDHTHSKFGKSRPWFLWMALPYSVVVWLLFTTPDLSGTSKIVYAGVMYLLADFVYITLSTPITAVLPNITSDSNERMSANSIRLVLGNVGNWLAVTFVIPLAVLFGNGNDKKGWSLAVGMYAVIAFILLIIAFFDMREKNIYQEKVISIKDSFKSAKGNWPWVIIVLANVIFWTSYATRNAALPYYFQYNMGDQHLTSIFNGFSIIQVIGMASVPFIARYLHKWGTTVLMLGTTIVGHLMIGMAGANVNFALVGWCVVCIGSGSALTMFFAMIGDTVDFGEWKTGIRANGFLTAIGASFCIQMGQGIGPFITSMIMNIFGFDAANKIQTKDSIQGIAFSFIWAPIIICSISLIIMLFYRKWENNEHVIKADLEKRHQI
ncbi:MFS transporter [Dellaglioa sp. L3N]